MDGPTVLCIKDPISDFGLTDTVSSTRFVYLFKYYYFE